MLKEIYEFLGEEEYTHDFNNVKQVTIEDDITHGFYKEALHTIKNKVQPNKNNWTDVFDDIVTKTQLWKEITDSSKFWKYI